MPFIQVEVLMLPFILMTAACTLEEIYIYVMHCGRIYWIKWPSKCCNTKLHWYTIPCILAGLLVN